MNFFCRCVLLMTALFLGPFLLRGQDSARFMEVTFKVDGVVVSCASPRVDLRVGTRHFAPRMTPTGFVVPAIFQKLYASKRSRSTRDVNVGASCGSNVWSFSSLYPVSLLPGRWEFGVATPPYWYVFDSGRLIDHGTWISYLEDDCNECDPGVIISAVHDQAPPALVQRLQSEQATASGERAGDIAFSLAVLQVDERRNAHYLLGLLRSTDARPESDQRDDVEDKLIYELANLYWRGDTELLLPLLRSADSLQSSSQIGPFYANLLDGRTETALGSMNQLPTETQQAVCRLAVVDDLSFDPPKLNRVIAQLQASSVPAASTCLREAVTVRSANDKRLQ